MMMPGSLSSLRKRVVAATLVSPMVPPICLFGPLNLDSTRLRGTHLARLLFADPAVVPPWIRATSSCPAADQYIPRWPGPGILRYRAGNSRPCLCPISPASPKGHPLSTSGHSKSPKRDRSGDGWASKPPSSQSYERAHVSLQIQNTGEKSRTPPGCLSCRVERREARHSSRPH